MSQNFSLSARTLGLILIALTLAACKPAVESAAESAAGPLVEVWKSPTCSCCSKWIEHLKSNGFRVVVNNEAKMTPVKAALGVPQELASCHSAKVGGYVVEGHVPASDIKRLLDEHPEGKGIAAPGMPIGSPGMEDGNQHPPYKVVQFGANGERRVFSAHGAQTGTDAATTGTPP